ncbi:unnamed protein product [Moneuplotes crassus]|uniref:Uncharacterized protein n=1 Tax=Euplotes crassus TaxID=5936 RepID=A0AAD1XWG9_EUPCR|nr:unnamed protein product [Moneuplotes crassus]
MFPSLKRNRHQRHNLSLDCAQESSIFDKKFSVKGRQKSYSKSPDSAKEYQKRNKRYELPPDLVSRDSSFEDEHKNDVLLTSVKKVNKGHIKNIIESLSKQGREKRNGAYLCRKRLARMRRQKENDYALKVDSLIYNTNKEFHSLSFASNLKRLLVPKWTEDPSNFICHSELTPEGHDRVHRIMENKFGRFS